MNLTRALEVALPDIPARKLAESYPRLDPGTSSREHIEDGARMVRVYVPSCSGMYTLTPQQWEVVQLFDGKRSYAEIAELFSQQNNTEFDADAVREFSEALEAGDFWYKTPQEKNILLMNQTAAERRKKTKVRSKWADLSDVNFPAFNPDRFLTWFYNHTKFFYTPWFTVVTLIGFLLSGVVTVAHWNEIWRDTMEFYNFSNKTWGDVFALYTLGMAVVAIHEFAHAHTCKHYGGRVPAMGFALVYLTPAFFTDTTEGFVKGTRYQRFIIAMAGIWSELMLFAIATPIWLDTHPQTLVHDSAHFIMMMTGLMSLILNWNPLMKLDGYYMLCEMVGIRDLKEDSTAYISGWVKRHIWRLPVEVPYVPKRRRIGYAAYALLSGAYSYTVLYILARFAGNFVRNFSPEWGFVPEIGVALIIFRSRIRLLVNFMKFFYLDKKDRISEWFTLRNSALAAAAAAVLLALPLWHESVSGSFLLEPMQSVEIRARVPGMVQQIEVNEGQSVSAGQPLMSLRNLFLVSEFENARANLAMASDRTVSAALHYTGYGASLAERNRLTLQVRQLQEMSDAMEITSPIAGVVLTPKLHERLGEHVTAGEELMKIADLSVLRARIYVSEWDVSKVRVGAGATLQVQGFVQRWHAEARSIAPRAKEMDPGLAGDKGLKESAAAQYYLVDLVVPNTDGKLRPGMIGLGRVYGRRISAAGLGWEAVSNFWGRKLW